MTTSDKIGSSHVEAMEKILKFIETFDVHKLLYAITEKSLDEGDIKSITFDIREWNLKLEREKTYLFDYTKTCNKEYALRDNKLVDSSARMSRKMRSGISGIKKVVKRFCKKSRQKLRPGQKEPQAIDRTLLAAEQYMRDLFGLESYPSCVKELFLEMIGFFSNMDACLQEATRSLSEEKEIREDERRCLELLRQACERCRQTQQFLIEAMEKDPSLKAACQKSAQLQPSNENPVLKAYVCSEDDKEKFASDFYHNCSPEDVSKIALYRTMSEADGDRDLMASMAIFGCDKEKARHINLAISRFDSLLPERCKRGKVPAIHLYVFMRWCSEGIGYETFLGYFNRRYKEAGGQLEPIGKSALSGAARKEYTDEKFAKIKRTILIKLERMSPNEQAQQSA